jgi:hypothetical protein
MSTVKTWLLYVVGCAFGWSIILSGCASTPQILIVPPIADRVEPPPYGTKDYAQTLAAIMSVMVLDLKLPAVEASVTLYPSQASYESGVVAESERDRERLRKQLGSGANQLREDELVLAARRSAVSSQAVGMYRKVLVNEWRVSKFLWPEWIRLLAHELTHAAQREPSMADCRRRTNGCARVSRNGWDTRSRTDSARKTSPRATAASLILLAQ